MSQRPTDYKVRQRVIDPAQSFILQAPAGSGKTTLLVERYLNLLLQTQDPTQIWPLHLPKAAQNMRVRIIAALQDPSRINHAALVEKLTHPSFKTVINTVLTHQHSLNIMTPLTVLTK